LTGLPATAITAEFDTENQSSVTGLVISHNAGGPLGGYLWQVRRGLLALVRASIGDAISIEARDDVVIFRSDGVAVASMQTKHSYGHGSVTTSSRDVWTTFRAWLDFGEPRAGDGTAKLVLVTTGDVADGSSLLPFRLDPESSATPSQFAVAKLVTELDKIARSRPNQRLQAAYDAWEAASAADRDGVVTKLRVVSAQDKLSSVDARILEEIAKFVPPIHQTAFAERILGWFDALVAERLSSNGCRISRQELTEHVYDLIQSLPPATTFDLYATAAHPEPEAEVATAPPYIRQLNLLNAAQEQLSLAVHLHHRAQLQRDRVMQTTLCGQQQLDAFDTDLRDFWGLKFRPNGIATDAVSFGWSVHDSCMGYTVSIAGGMAPRFFVSGSYHELADRLQVGWHPGFRQHLP
jgi:hypothetical protein